MHKECLLGGDVQEYYDKARGRQYYYACAQLHIKVERQGSIDDVRDIGIVFVHFLCPGLIYLTHKLIFNCNFDRRAEPISSHLSARRVHSLPNHPKTQQKPHAMGNPSSRRSGVWIVECCPLAPFFFGRLHSGPNQGGTGAGPVRSARGGVPARGCGSGRRPVA